jgi:uncharacterized protein (DUF2252 family)
MATGTLSPDERAARGKAARGQASRSSHAAWRAPGDRRSPIAVLEEQARTRVPELVPIRYGRMVESPFAYFRGAAAAMAADLSRTPASGLRAQLCGDAHLSNFGGFASPDRDLVFDLNDFDETLPGPWEWDAKRLVASFEIAGRSRDFDRDQRSATVTAAAREYRLAMRRFATMPDLAVWYARLDADEVIRRWGAEENGKTAKVVRRAAEKARAKDSMRALAKLTCRVDGELRIASDAPLVVRIEELVGPEDGRDVSEEIDRVLQAYRRTLSGGARHALAPYRLVDVARKVVGVGSVGTRAHIVLLLGRDASDPLFLQVKEAERSVLEPHAGASRFVHHGRRVVEGQWLMQAASDIFLGWVTVPGIDGKRRDFYVRQLWDWKRSAEIELMTPDRMAGYAEMCGWTLARAHARSGDRIAIGAYLGNGDAFDRAMVRFARAYADQNERDHEALVGAIRDGTLPAERGV